VVANYGKLLVASRNLDFFTSFYRFLIQLLPAAVVAPLFFAGEQPGRLHRQWCPSRKIMLCLVPAHTQ
jgi:hypothetical protein